MEAFPSLLGLETKTREGLFSNGPGLGFFFRGLEDHGKASIQLVVTLAFFLVALDPLEKRRNFGAKSG